MNTQVNPRGVDLSTWNLTDADSIDWNLFKQYYSFVITKASEGKRVDHDFLEIYNGAKDAGVAIGAYHYFRFRSLAYSLEQADFFWNTIKYDPPELGGWNDVEDYYFGNNYTRNSRVKWVQAFNDRFRSKASVPIGIYTNTGFWTSMMAPYAYETSIPYNTDLWVANWFVSEPAIPYDWKVKTGDKYTFWQNTNREDLEHAGIPDSTVDGNWYYGTYAKFNQQFGTNISVPTETPITVPQPDPDSKVIKIWGLQSGYRLNVRVKPWGHPKLQTWNGEKYKVLAIKGYNLNPEKYWIKIAGHPTLENELVDQWVASWYTIAV